MIKTVKTNGIVLSRTHSKLGEIITWDVLNSDKTIRLGVIRQINDHYRVRRVGYQRFPIKVWLGSKFWPSTIVVGETRKEVIQKLLEAK